MGCISNHQNFGEKKGGTVHEMCYKKKLTFWKSEKKTSAINPISMILAAPPTDWQGYFFGLSKS